mgnify:CR=1 FL=1
MNKWPVFSEKEVIVGNPEAELGIATLWTPREKFVEMCIDNEGLSKIAIIGNLYSVFGIGVLIRNYLSNPKLRSLVITGTELGNSRSVMEKLNTRENIADIAKKLYLSEEHIKRFLNQTNIYFFEKHNINAFVLKGIFNHADDQTFPKIIVDLPEPKADFFPSSKSGHLIRVRYIEEGYQKLLKEIRLFGHITNQDSEGQRRQELWELNMVITIQDPEDFSSIPHPEYSPEQIQKYCEDFWKGSEPKDLAYRYGHIIRFAYGDQVEAVKKAFKDKAETFRTVMSLWNPGESIREKDPPCITVIHPRIIGDYLHLWAYIRTNDMFGGWSLNAAALRYFQYKLLEELRVELKRQNLQLGEMGVTSGSAHIYERNWLAVDSFLGEEKLGVSDFDPKGNFEVKTRDGKITVNHYSPNGEELLQVFTGITARELSRKIEPFISQISNALYVGRALQKAEEEVKNANSKD